MLGSALMVAVPVLEATVDANEKVVSFEAETNATSVTNLDTLHANAKKTKTFATVATVLDILRKTANRGLR